MFGGKKKSQIPPVEAGRAELLGPRAGASSGGRAPSPGSQYAGSAYAPSERAPSYRTTASSSAPPPRGSSSSSRVPAPPTGGYGQNMYGSPEHNRAELFRGAKPPSESFGRGDLDRPDRYASGSSGGDVQVQDEDDEVEAIKQQIRFTKQESLASTRNALRTAREAEETARNTLGRLGDQSERIANTERSIDMANAHNERAADEAKEIKALNRSIFRPTFTWNKQAKRDAAEQRIVDRHEREREDREEVRRQVFDSRERVGGAFREMDRQAEKAAARKGRPTEQATSASQRIAQRGRYTFEADEEDEGVEQELDDNLGEIGDLSKRLNLLARAAGDEVRAQNQKLGQLSDKVDTVDSAIFRNTQRLQRIK